MHPNMSPGFHRDTTLWRLIFGQAKQIYNYSDLGRDVGEINMGDVSLFRNVTETMNTSECNTLIFKHCDTPAFSECDTHIPCGPPTNIELILLEGL